MALNMIYPEFEVVRNPDRCIACRVCERQCANEVHRYDPDLKKMLADESKCVNCHRCVTLCPTRALKIVKTGHTFRENGNWSGQAINEVYRQAESGGVLLSSMGNPKDVPRLLGQNAHQRLPGDQPLHRPPAGAHGDQDLPGAQAHSHPPGRRRGHCPQTCLPSWSCPPPSCFPP